MKHVNDFGTWKLNEGAVKEKLVEIAEKAVATKDKWLTDPKKPFDQMAEDEIEIAVDKDIDAFFISVKSEYDIEFLEGNRESIVSLISSFLA